MRPAPLLVMLWRSMMPARRVMMASALYPMRRANLPREIRQAAPEGKSFLDFSPEVRLLSIAAGLGMMASRSPWAGVAIGEGGLKGIGAYQEAQKLGQQGQLGQAQIQNLKSESNT